MAYACYSSERQEIVSVGTFYPLTPFPTVSYELPSILFSFRSHALAMECLNKSPSCDTHKMFKTATGTIEKMCGERAQLFEKMRPCLEKNGDIPAQGSLCFILVIAF